MPANNKEFPWPSYYGHFDYFENMMRKHRKVARLGTLGDGLYEIERTSGKPLVVFVCQCYSFGVAEYLETTRKLGQLNAIVIDSAWCGYTIDAKHTCYEHEVGLFKITEFMAALNKPKFWTYLIEYEKEAFKKRGWL